MSTAVKVVNVKTSICIVIHWFAVTKNKYFLKGELNCNTNKITCLIFCKLCSKQYVGSATNLKIG